SPSPTIAAASHSPSPTASPLPSLPPSPSVAPTVSASLPISVTIGSPASVVVDGRAVGQATVLSAKYRKSLNGENAPSGMRWLLVSIQLTASGVMDYDE